MATCQLDNIESCLHEEAVDKALESMPVRIEEMYSKILDRINSNVHKEDAIRILQLLIFSQRPLTIDELVDAIAVNVTANTSFRPESRVPVPREIIKICSSLVSATVRRVSRPETRRRYRGYSKDKQYAEVKEVIVLQLAHLSVREYLTSGQAETTFSMFFTENIARGSITRVCLAYLSHLDEHIPISEIKERFAFAQYSAQYWMDHAKLVETEKDVQKSILDFLLHRRQVHIIWFKLFNREDPSETLLTQAYYYDTIPFPTPLYYVSLAGLVHTARSLIEKGADVNTEGGAYGNALQAASVTGDEQMVRLLLDKQAYVNKIGGDFSHALYAASSFGHTKVVQLLLDRGADINAPHYKQSRNRIRIAWPDYSAPQALHAASLGGYDEVVSLLLDKGADINAYGGYTYCHALCIAYMHNQAKVVQLLLERGADVNYGDSGIEHIIQIASKRGDEKMVRLLLTKGADFNLASNRGSPLYFSSLFGHTSVVKLLCENHTHINSWGQLYGNALQAASNGGYDKVVKLLLDKKVDVNESGGYYGNALQAASSGGHEKVVRLLVHNGADVNAHVGVYCYDADEEVIRISEDGSLDNPQGCAYDNALQVVSLHGNKSMVQLLLDSGANVNIDGGKYGSALQAACTKGHVEVVQLLLNKGADTNFQGGKYQNALHTSSFGGYRTIVQLLLQKGAEINKKGGYYGNALQAAASQGHEEVVQLLLKNGADANAEGGKYQYALRAAQLGGHKKVAEVLLANGADAKYGRDVYFKPRWSPPRMYIERRDGNRVISRKVFRQ